VQQRDVVRHKQCATGLMPAGAIEDQQRDRAGANLGADLLKVLVHGLGVHRGHDDGGTDPAGGTDRAEQMHAIVTVVSHHWRARPNRCPNIGVGALLAHPGFIAKPDFDGLASGVRRQGFRYQVSEVFLKVSCAAASFLG